MKTYRIEHTRPGADDPCDEWVPAEVAQRLYDALSDLVDSTCGFYPFDGDDHPSVIEANAALAAADGEEV